MGSSLSPKLSSLRAALQQTRGLGGRFLSGPPRPNCRHHVRRASPCQSPFQGQGLRPRPHCPRELFKGEGLGGSTHHSPAQWPKFLRWRKKARLVMQTGLSSSVPQKVWSTALPLPPCAFVVSGALYLFEQSAKFQIVGLLPSVRPARRQYVRPARRLFVRPARRLFVRPSRRLFVRPSRRLFMRLARRLFVLWVESPPGVLLCGHRK